MQPLHELEQWYEQADPWNYQKDPEDQYRKSFYLAIVEDVGPNFNKALDIGAGEGWITKDLPAPEIHALEVSDNASSRLPPNVRRVLAPEGHYDFVMATGLLYPQYDHAAIAQNIHDACTTGTTVFIAGISSWLQPYTFGNPIRSFDILYREYVHNITVWEYQ